MLRLVAEASKYILALAGAIVISIVILHGWFARGESPPTLLIVGLVVFALVPVADRIKVFDWIDFRKSISNLSQEMESNKSQIGTVAEELQNLTQSMSLTFAAQEHQQIFNTNISVPSEAMALELAKQLGIPRRSDESAGSSTDSEISNRLDWVDQITLEISAFLRVLMVAERTMVSAIEIGDNSQPTTESIAEIMGLGLPGLIEHFEEVGGVIRHVDGKFLRTTREMTMLANLKTVLSDIKIYRNGEQEPSPKEIENLIEEANTALGYFSAAAFIIVWVGITITSTLSSSPLLHADHS